MATFHFDLVSPESLLLSEAVDQVDVPGFEGDFAFDEARVRGAEQHLGRPRRQLGGRDT